MKEIRVHVPDEQYRFVMQLLQKLSLQAEPVKPAKPTTSTRKLTPAQQEWVDDFREALEQVELHEQGKIKLQSLSELIDELRDNPDSQL